MNLLFSNSVVFARLQSHTSGLPFTSRVFNDVNDVNLLECRVDNLLFDKSRAVNAVNDLNTSDGRVDIWLMLK